MEKISSLRERLQGPRRPYDTLYGRFVMRRFSIYLTVLFSKLGMSPKGVTLLSVICGLSGVWMLFAGHWFYGILLVNGWYLLDHSDGELARLQTKSSLGGLYFDTIANALIPPLTFVALGADLARRTGDLFWALTGFAAGLGYEMLLIIPFCEAAVLLQWSKAGPLTLEIMAQPASVASVASASHPSASFPKKCFAGCHWAATFPSALPVLTAALAVQTLLAAQAVLFFYTFLVTAVWSLILVQTIATDKLDKKYVKAR